jgi:hypothetical protein
VTEVVQARAEIDRSRQFQLRFQATADLLRDAVLEAVPGSMVQVSDTLLYGVLMSQVIDVPMSNVSSFVASDAFELLDDDELRATISQWVPALQDLRDDQLLIRRLKDEVIKPTLRLESDIARAQGLTNSWSILRGSVDASEIGTTDVRASPALRALIVELSGL